VEKHGTPRQITDNNIIRHMHFTCWINNVTKTHSKYVILNHISMATIVTRTRLDVKFTRTLHFLFTLNLAHIRERSKVLTVPSPSLGYF
jgi:hypothetical protein